MAELTERIVRYRQITYWDEVENQAQPNGDPVFIERIASKGEVVQLRPQDEQRLDAQPYGGALYTPEEQSAIEDGTYSGFDADHLALVRAQGHTQGPAPPPEQRQLTAAPGEAQDIGNEGPQTEGLSIDELAEYIRENDLTPDQTVALAGDDPDSINRVLDAETQATDNDPRQEVVGRLESKLAYVTEVQAASSAAQHPGAHPAMPGSPAAQASQVAGKSQPTTTTGGKRSTTKRSTTKREPTGKEGQS